MLFDRFVFIIYILFNYSWLLLGIVYDSPIRIIPVVSLLLSLLSIQVVTIFQLQTIIQHQKLDFNSKWSTIAWSGIHLFLCLFFSIDILELTNIFLVFAILGIFITLVSVSVLIMSCKVIASSSDDWIPHVHLTCVCFWILSNYLYVSLPVNLPFMTVLPVILMFILRLYETTHRFTICIETILFSIAIALHICLDTQKISSIRFYQMISITIALMILISGELKSIIMIFFLPFLCISFIVYSLLYSVLYKEQPSMQYFTTKYNDFVRLDDLILPIEAFENDDENWDEKL